MSTLKVNNIEPRTGGEVAIGQSGGTVTIEGDVGLGTPSPEAKLEVSKGLVRLNRAGSDSDTSAGALEFAVDGAQHAMIASENSYNLKFITDNTERMRIDGNGRVKFNDSFDGTYIKTDVNSTANRAFISAYRAGDGVVSGSRVAILAKGDGAGNAVGLRFDTNDAERMRIDANGRVDITGSLYVNGTPKIGADELIQTLSTLRNATKDETTFEGLRDSLSTAIGGLIEEFEALQLAAAQEFEAMQSEAAEEEPQ